MILLDAIYINNSGGKILLDYLIQNLLATDKKVFYLLDKRVEDSTPYLPVSDNVLFLQASFINRHKFYKENRDKFSTVFCFGDLPPSIKLKNATVYTYFHQQLYIKVPKTVPFKQRMMLLLKRRVLKSIFNNTDYWALQTQQIKNDFLKKFKFKESNVLILPFYPSLQSNVKTQKIKNSFVYISNAPPHKNHLRLIKAFCLFYDNNKTGSLTLSISDNFTELITLIKNKQLSGYPIHNLGFIDRDQLTNVYQKSEYLVFPSLAESFGLGIVEAIQNDCKVIGSDLPYLYSVCEPSLVFNPLDEDSIEKALTKAVNQKLNDSIAKVYDEIDDVLKILT